MIPTKVQLKRLVGNPEAYAQQTLNGYIAVRKPLTDDVLRAHLQQNITVGTYFVKGDQARVLCIDVDEADDLDEAHAAAICIKDELIRIGFEKKYIGIEFSGSKGYHVWLPFASWVKASDIRRVGKTVLNTLQMKYELFPKQDEQRELGSLVKLPGSLHVGTGKLCEFIDNIPSVCSKRILADVLADLPEEPPKQKSRYEGDEGIPCVARILEGAPQGHRDTCLFHCAVMLRKGGVVGEPQQMLIQRAADKSTPPYDERDLTQLVESSNNSGPKCGELPEDIHCGEACIMNRTPGLHMREKQIHFAQKGEKVVVEVSGRDEDKVRLDHPDIRSGGLVVVK